MSSENTDKDWKLKLRLGKITTPYQHFTVLAEGIAGKLSDGFNCPPGKAFIGMKTWASSVDESAHMLTLISRQIGFTIKGKIQVYETDPMQAPQQDPYGYDITFTPFNSAAV